MVLHIGDKVKLGDKEHLRRIGELDPHGMMYKYANTIVTIREFCGGLNNHFFIVEDEKDTTCNGRPGWLWKKEHIVEFMSTEKIRIDNNLLLNILGE